MRLDTQSASSYICRPPPQRRLWRAERVRAWRRGAFRAASGRRRRLRPSAPAITRADDDGSQNGGSEAGANGGGADAAWYRDEGAHGAVEALLGGEFAPPAFGEPRVDARPAVFQRFEGGG